ncbi:Vacuolar fusion CCZ1-like protein [Nymphaea thermarum]|nr:Vacuolar fusion CCZ1-like protein [Nymphaea thermarum]
MGTASRTVAGEGVQLCVFDSRRGHREGDEHDKILFFFPADCTLPTQLSVVGLSDGLITFTRTFSPEAACEVIEADRHSHVFYQAEPDIWMVMVLEKSNDLDPVRRTGSLQQLLMEVHSLFVMFFGTLRSLLEKHPDGAVARSYLYFFIMDYLSDFLVGKKLQMPSFYDCLKERGTVEMLSLSRETAIEIQLLIRLLESSSTANGPCTSVVLFHDLMVSSTLSPVDTANLFTYAGLRLIPSAVSSGSNSWSYLRKGTASSPVNTSSLSLNSRSILEDQYRLHDTSPSRPIERYVVPRPLQRDKWRKGKDGFLVTDAWGAEVGSLVVMPPKVWLHQAGEYMHLLVHQYKNLTIILLVPVSSLVNGEQGISLMKQQLIEMATLQILKVEEKLSRDWGGINAYHVRGYRYLLLDEDINTSRASPPGKVATLSKGSLLALSKLREQVDWEKKRTKWDDPGNDKDLEVCIRANNNSWIVARLTRGKELYIVLEKAGETLLYASDALMKFSDR